MTDSGRRPQVDPRTLDTRGRAAWGARRGALAGVYFFGIYFLVDTIRERDTYLRVAPFTAAAAVIAGFVIAGVLLLINLPYVRSTWSAVGLGIVSAYPGMLGLMISSVGWRPAVLVGALVAAVIIGGIGGVILFRRWNRQQ